MKTLPVVLHLCALVALLFMVTLFACYATEPRFSASADALRYAGCAFGLASFAFFVVADVVASMYQRAMLTNTRNMRSA